jgi:hypothetical protein
MNVTGEISLLVQIKGMAVKVLRRIPIDGMKVVCREYSLSAVEC